jgi:hypothetical protein
MLALVSIVMALVVSAFGANQVAPGFQITFYGYPDNDPPGADTAHNCGGRNYIAAGIGTYASPLTMAMAPGIFSTCEIVYSPYLKKYLRLEDDCASCSGNWIDVWVGSFTTNAGAPLLACEDTLTMSTGFYHNLVRSPTADLEVVCKYILPIRSRHALTYVS